MTELYSQCSNSNGRALANLYGVIVEELAEVRDYAANVGRSIVMTASPKDWRGWVLRVRDDLGEEIFVVPFAFVLRKPH